MAKSTSFIGALAFVLTASAAGAARAPTAPAPAAPSAGVQRIVIMRHGEKPDAGLGQLSCRGLSRALALPDAIIGKFGAPQFLFAANPSKRKPDRGTLYDYIRPLATIEPLAIRLGLPVDVQYGFDQQKQVARVVGTEHYAGALVVIAWEHHLAPKITRDLLKRHGGDAGQVAKWADDDFDRLDVVEITRTPGQPPGAQYRREQQGLNNLPDECPKGPSAK